MTTDMKKLSSTVLLCSTNNLFSSKDDTASNEQEEDLSPEDRKAFIDAMESDLSFGSQGSDATFPGIFPPSPLRSAHSLTAPVMLTHTMKRQRISPDGYFSEESVDDDELLDLDIITPTHDDNNNSSLKCTTNNNGTLDLSFTPPLVRGHCVSTTAVKDLCFSPIIGFESQLDTREFEFGDYSL
jgi:hypothetical protein